MTRSASLAAAAAGNRKNQAPVSAASRAYLARDGIPESFGNFIRIKLPRLESFAPAGRPVRPSEKRDFGVWGISLRSISQASAARRKQGGGGCAANDRTRASVGELTRP